MFDPLFGRSKKYDLSGSDDRQTDRRTRDFSAWQRQQTPAASKRQEGKVEGKGKRLEDNTKRGLFVVHQWKE